MKHLTILAALIALNCSLGLAAQRPEPEAPKELPPQVAKPPAKPAPAPAPKADEKIRFDFETGDLQGWKVFDGSFVLPICDRELFRNKQNGGRKWNKQGKYFLNTTNLPDDKWSDAQTGVIESPVFVLGGATASFLVGAGGHDDTYVALCTVDGTEVRQARGKSAELMRRITWDVKDLVGKKVFVKIVDMHTTGWGHVTFDDFQAVGKIDPAATATRWADRAKLEKARLARAVAEAKALAEKLTAERERKLAMLTDPKLLFERGQTRVYRGEHLGAISMPIGGNGSGCIQMDGKGVLRIWQIFNNMDQVFIPNSFLAVRAKTDGGRAIVRAVQTEPRGLFAPMKSVAFRGEYPFGWYDFEDEALPVRVSLEAFSPLIPLDAKSSAAPCVVLSVTAENTGAKPVDVTLLASQQNAVGYVAVPTPRNQPVRDARILGRKYSRYGANRNEVVEQGEAMVLHMTGDAPRENVAYGDMALAVLGDNVSATASWDTLATLAADLADDGKLTGPDKTAPSPAGQTVDGALASSFTLSAGQKRTVTFLLTWHFPNGKHGSRGWGGDGNMYANWWPNAKGVAKWLAESLPDLTRKTRLYHDSLYESNLPVWLLDRVSSQAAVLRSRTCFWTKSGYFGGWEGCNRGSGCCHGNCSHVWHYAQLHARLFPEIGRRMREQELAHQNPDGGIQFRQGSPKVAFDGTCGTVLGAYREHRLSADGAWLKKHWPRTRKAMDFLIATWDKDGDGVLAGAQHNTLDGELGGSTTWLGGMYLASLAASEKMAILQGQDDLAKRYRKIRLSGEKKQDATLWNGEYYIQLPDGQKRQDYNNGCAIDQMLGQWWAHELDLGWLYPPDRVRTAMQALLKHNFRMDFRGVPQKPRKFVAEEDAGLQMICWPKGDRPPNHIRYADEVMSGFEYSAAAAMVQAGLLREGFAVIKAAYDRYDGRLRTKLAGDLQGGRSAWGYSGNPFGDDECGKFYARPMSIWSMLTASQGFVYDGPAGLIGFLPLWKPEDHRSFFTAAEGWGVFSQTRTGKEQTERIEVRNGTLAVSTLVFAPAGVVSDVTVTAAGKKVKATYKLEDGRLTVSLGKSVTVEAGQSIEVVIK